MVEVHAFTALNGGLRNPVAVALKRQRSRSSETAQKPPSRTTRFASKLVHSRPSSGGGRRTRTEEEQSSEDISWLWVRVCHGERHSRNCQTTNNQLPNTIDDAIPRNRAPAFGVRFCRMLRVIHQTSPLPFGARQSTGDEGMSNSLPAGHLVDTRSCHDIQSRLPEIDRTAELLTGGNASAALNPGNDGQATETHTAGRGGDGIRSHGRSDSRLAHIGRHGKRSVVLF